MKWVLIIVGALLILIGGVWALQGLNILTQGAMAGHMKWTLIGGILALAGIVLVVVGASRRKSTRAA
jgi:uncharacterized integral membrane protein